MATKPEQTTTVTTEIGAAILGHFMAELLSGERLSDPAEPEDLHDLESTIMNQTGLSPDEVTVMEPAIVAEAVVQQAFLSKLAFYRV